MKEQLKLVAHKTCHYVILEYFIKYKAMKEVLSATDIINTMYTEEIIRNHKCQMRFLDKFIYLLC